MKRRSLAEKLQGANVTLKKVEGQQLFAAAVTQLEAEKNASALIRHVLEGFPANVVESQVIGEPRIVNKSETEVTLAYDLQIAVNPSRYDQWLSKLVPVLEKVAIRKGEWFAKSNVGKRERGDGIDTLLTGYWTGFQPTRVSQVRSATTNTELLRTQTENQSSAFGAGWWDMSLDSKTHMAVVVNTARGGSDESTTWKWFNITKPDAFCAGLLIDIRFVKSDSPKSRSRSHSIFSCWQTRCSWR